MRSSPNRGGLTGRPAEKDFRNWECRRVTAGFCDGFFWFFFRNFGYVLLLLICPLNVCSAKLHSIRNKFFTVNNVQPDAGRLCV
jgi:hypothetical protein